MFTGFVAIFIFPTVKDGIIYHPGRVRQVLFLENQNTPDVIPGHELVVYIVKVDT